MFHVCANDNVKLAVYALNPGGIETVLMVHGWPLSHEIYEYQTELLVKCGYRVVTVDVRGFGNSDAPAAGYCYDQLADDIYTVVRSLNLGCFTLVGFCLGGAIALRYMKRYEGYGVKRLMLLGAAAPSFVKGPYPYGTSEENMEKMIALISSDRPELCYDLSRMMLAMPHSEAVKDWFYQISLRASGIGTLQSACSLRDEDCTEDLKSVQVPTGIFHGKKDLIVPFKLAKIQDEMICNSILYPFESSGHAVFYDELEEFNKCFLDFLEGRY